MTEDRPHRLLLEREIKRAVKTSLSEWGVADFVDSQEEIDFGKRAIAHARKTVHRKTKSPHWDVLEADLSFPVSPVEAIAHVLKEAMLDADQIGTERRIVVTDTLGSNFEPRFKSNEGKFILKRDFYNIPPKLLSPYHRFHYRCVASTASFIFQQWYDGSTPDTLSASAEGLVLEALVSCHLVYKMDCTVCNKQDTLRWNGGGGASSAWSDVVCVGCHTYYEIKTKRDPTAIEKNWEQIQVF